MVWLFNVILLNARKGETITHKIMGESQNMLNKEIRQKRAHLIL